MQWIDEWLIKHCQEGYNYIWDRWGVRIGTILGIAYCFWIVGTGTQAKSAGAWVFIGIIGLMGLVMGAYRCSQQDEGKFREINDTANETQNSIPLRFMRLFFPLFFVADYFNSDIKGAVITASLLVAMFAFCLKVRERDESRFKVHKLAPERIR